MTPSLRSYQRQCCQANTNGTGRSDGNEEADVDYEGPSPLPFHFHFLPLTILSLLNGRHSNGGRSDRDRGRLLLLFGTVMLLASQWSYQQQCLHTIDVGTEISDENEEASEI
jgi:hypothetical protein